MIKKYINLLIIFIFISSCGYTPIYSNSSNNKFKLIIKNVEGDTSVNNLIKSQLFKYQKINSENIFEVDVRSQYNKAILSKSATGAVTNYRITVDSNFNIKNKNISKIITITESLDMKKEGSLFEEKNYEKLIKKDLVNIVTNKLILEINKIE
tara:strand:+ start:73 stop:531 length:459 start_codon:yes stop_codon:yes gene_type:complete